MEKGKNLPETSAFRNAFLKKYQEINGVSYDTSGVYGYNLDSVILYFAKKESFFECKNIVKKINGRVLKPSFKKGLLILGGYGCGKTSTMLAFHKVFFSDNRFRFIFSTSNDLVEEYECCQEPKEKKEFWDKIKRGTLFVDDIKTERDASNFGKINLFKDLIEKIYSKGNKMYMSCNYANGHIGNIDFAINEFGERYGGRVYDRLFEMFNVLEFKGKSLRI